jgi:two-component system OmpR family sensor kinase
MGLLVDDLLLLARLDQQRPILHEPVDVLQLARDAAHDASAVAPDREVSVDVTGDGPPIVMGDDARLRQVFGNLVTNALTHTPAGGPIRVRVGADNASGMAAVEVIDTGPGLSAEQSARVFERFYRADASRTRAHGGTGLGLSIVAALVAAHGGRVEVDSEPGHGATFRVLLPLAPSYAT